MYIYQGGIGRLKKFSLFSIILLCVSFLSVFAQEIDLIDRAPQAKWGSTAGDTLAFGVDGRERGIARYEHDGVKFSVSFSPDNKYLVTANVGGVAKVWNVQDGKELMTLEHSSPAQRVFSATFGPDGKYIVTAGDDQTAKIRKLTK